MANPTIVATGSTTAPNTAGVSKREYVVGETLTFTDPANGGAATHLWELIDVPPEQSSALVGPTTAAPTLVIDAGVEGGSFRIRYTADSTEVGELIFAVQTTAVDVPNQRIPGYLEQDDARAGATEGTWNEGGNTKGWFPDLYAVLKAIIAAFAGTFRKTVDGEINAVANKVTPAGADVVLIEDSAASFAKKNILVSTLLGSGTDNDAIHDNVAGEINAITAKGTPVAADVIVIEDSADSFNKKKATLTNLLGGGAAAAVEAAQGEFLVATLSTQQNNVADTDPILWDVLQQNHLVDVSIDLVTNKGRFSLPANRTFVINVSMRITDSVAVGRTFELWDVTANAAVPGTIRRMFNATATSSTGGSQTLSVPIKPTVATEYEIRMADSQTTSTDIIVDGSALAIYEIGAVQAEVVGGLEFLDIIEVGVATQQVDFGASGDGLLQRALDGEIDENYVIESFIINPTGSAVGYDLYPNGSAMATTDANRIVGGNSVVTANTEPGGRFQVVNSTLDGRATCDFQAKSGVNRFYNSQVAGRQGATDAFHQYFGGGWFDTGVTITSLGIRASLAGAIGVGSFFVLYRRTRRNVRADSAATYERNVEAPVAQGTAAEVEYSLGIANFGGSAIGIGIKLEGDTVTAGTITARLKVAGTTVLTAVLDTTNTSKHKAITSPGIFAVASLDDLVVGIETSGLTTSGGLTPGVTVNASFVNEAFIQAPEIAASQRELWQPPSVATGIIDEEFDDPVASAAAWTQPFAISGSLPDVTAKFATGDMRLDFGTQRASWMRLQNQADSTLRNISYLLPSTPDGVYYARIHSSYQVVSAQNGDGNFQFLLAESIAGPTYDPASHVGVQYEFDTGNINIQAFQLGGSGTARETGDMDGGYLDTRYFAIHKIGTQFDCWISSGGTWQWLQRFTHSGTLDRIVISQNVINQNSPGNPIVYCDFVRYVADPAEIGL